MAMPLDERKQDGDLQPQTHSFGDLHAPPNGAREMALLALSHTSIEHQLYQAMHTETIAAGKRVGTFSTRRLMMLTGVNGYSSVRRGLSGLQKKLSIDRFKDSEAGDSQRMGVGYYVYHPNEIFSRRTAAGLVRYPKEIQTYEGNAAFGQAIERIINRYDLSRREAQVALCCAEGLTNAQIGERLYVSEETAKCHLRHVFVKMNVRRRTELISRLLAREVL
jgi:DNA-binding CsgD family transcriptional regulator